MFETAYPRYSTVSAPQKLHFGSAVLRQRPSVTRIARDFPSEYAIKKDIAKNRAKKKKKKT